jgi:hypothetical protein
LMETNRIMVLSLLQIRTTSSVRFPIDFRTLMLYSFTEHDRSVHEIWIR